MTEFGQLEFDPTLYRRRQLVDRGMAMIMMAAVVLAVVPLALILFYVVKEGAGALNLDLITQDPAAPGRGGGGVRNSIMGSLIMVGLGLAVGGPLAIATGVFLSEFGQNRAGVFLRFLLDVLSGIPSITVGLFIYGLVVVPQGRFTAFAGGLALAVILLPIVARITEEMLLLIPRDIREAGFALGLPRWKVVAFAVLPPAVPGIVTGIMLALSRIAGEAAPLLFTALGNQFYTTDVFHAMDALPLRIYVYATGPYDYWHEQAWAISLILVAFILAVSLVVRWVVGTRVVVRH